MRLSLRSTVFAASLAVPVLALAAFTTPSEVLQSIDFRNKPMAFSVEAQGHYDTTYAALWLRGSTQGSTPETAKATGTVTFDVAANEGKDTIRVRMRYRIVSGTGYVLFEQPIGKGEYHDLVSQALQGKTGMWFSTPLTSTAREAFSEEGLESLTAQEKENLVELINVAFSLEKSGNVYAIRLRQDAADAIAKHVTQLQKDRPELFESEPAVKATDVRELRKVLAKLNIAFKVTMNTDDSAKGVKFYTSYNDAYDGKSFGVVLQGNAVIRPGTLNVTAPKNAVSLEASL